MAIERSDFGAPGNIRAANRGVVFEWRLAREVGEAVLIKFGGAFDCLDFLALGIETRSDLGEGVVSLFVFVVFTVAAEFGSHGPVCLPMHARARVWSAVKISGRNMRVRGLPDLRLRLNHDGKKRHPIFFDADPGRALVILPTYATIDYVISELSFFRHVPFGLPSAIGRKRNIAFADNSIAVPFHHAPLRISRSWNSEACVGNIAHNPLHLYGLPRPVEIAVGDDFGVRLCRETASLAGRITSGFGKLDRRSVRRVGDEKMRARTFRRENFVAVKRGHAFGIRSRARDLDALIRNRAHGHSDDRLRVGHFGHAHDHFGRRSFLREDEIARANDRAIPDDAPVAERRARLY